MKQQTYLKLFLFFALFVSLTSCTKEQIPKDPIPVVTKTPEQILTANSWEVKELRAVSGNIIVTYFRGKTGNTFRFDNDYIVFKADSTGLYHLDDGTQYPITWKFDKTDKTILKYTVQYPVPLLVTWEHITYSDSLITYDEFYSRGTTNTHASGLRTPRAQ